MPTTQTADRIVCVIGTTLPVVCRIFRPEGWSLNSHIGKIYKMLKATVIPHPHLAAEERWFHDPRNDPLTLSEPGYDLFLQDICLAVAAKLQFSSIPQQREVAVMYWHQAPPHRCQSSLPW